MFIVNMDSPIYKISKKRAANAVTRALRRKNPIPAIPAIEECANDEMWGVRHGMVEAVEKFSKNPSAYVPKPRNENRKETKAGQAPVDPDSAEYENGFAYAKKIALAALRSGEFSIDDIDISVPDYALADYRDGCRAGLADAVEEFKIERASTLARRIKLFNGIAYDPESKAYKDAFWSALTETRTLLKEGVLPKEISIPKYDDGFDKDEYAGCCLGIKKAVGDFEAAKRRAAQSIGVISEPVRRGRSR